VRGTRKVKVRDGEKRKRIESASWVSGFNRKGEGNGVWPFGLRTRNAKRREV
jgi:hypothetical protein